MMRWNYFVHGSDSQSYFFLDQVIFFDYSKGKNKKVGEGFGRRGLQPAGNRRRLKPVATKLNITYQYGTD